MTKCLVCSTRLLAAGRRGITVVTAARALPALAAALLVSCATYSDVSEKRPHFIPRPVGGGILAFAEMEITKALATERREPLVALNTYLEAARTAEEQLQRNPSNAEAKRDYNFAVA